jgi:hypothetical protein
MESLLVFRSGSDRSAHGHKGCVQKGFLGKQHPRGGEPRKNNIAAEVRCATLAIWKKIKKRSMWDGFVMR